jgi:2-methylcitrate synthase
MEKQDINTTITKMVKGERLLIRGYGFDDLVENTHNLEEVIFLLINERLPNEQELKALIQTLSRNRNLPQPLKNCLESIPLTTDGLTVVGIAISFLGALETNSLTDEKEIVYRIISLIGPITAYWYILHTSGKRIETYTGESDTIVENLLKLFFQEEYKEKLKFAKSLNQIMTIASDMGIPPASAHVSRVTASVCATIYSSVAAGVLAFSGKYHGAAGYLCGEMLEGIKTEQEAKDYVHTF